MYNQNSDNYIDHYYNLKDRDFSWLAQYTHVVACSCCLQQLWSTDKVFGKKLPNRIANEASNCCP